MCAKWGSSEEIHVGDIFECWFGPYGNQPETDWYQVTALRGRTQVKLRPLRMETYINEEIQEGSSLYWRRERKRPLPGQFMEAEKLIALTRYERGREIRRTGEEVTAWVLPDRTAEGRLLLQEVLWKSIFSLARPEDWAPWDSETIRQMEEEDRREREDVVRRLLPEKAAAEFLAEMAKKEGTAHE